MPPRPTSAGKKDSKKGKKGKKKSTKSAEVDPHQEELDRLIREREDLRSKFNVVCSRIIENVNMEDYQADVDLSKQQPSDIPINLLLSMIEQICYYRVAFLSLFQEADDQRTISVHRKVTQLAIDEPEMFRRRLTPEQRLTFVTKERDIWKENAQILQTMYAAIGKLSFCKIKTFSFESIFFLSHFLVDQLEVGVFKKVTQKFVRSNISSFENLRQRFFCSRRGGKKFFGHSDRFDVTRLSLASAVEIITRRKTNAQFASLIDVVRAMRTASTIISA